MLFLYFLLASQVFWTWQIRQPILFLSGLQDEMVPPSYMQILYAKAATHNKQCIFVDFPNGMHMDTWLTGGDRYWRTIQLFLEQNVPKNKENDSYHNENGNILKHQILPLTTSIYVHVWCPFFGFYCLGMNIPTIHFWSLIQISLITDLFACHWSLYFTQLSAIFVPVLVPPPWTPLLLLLLLFFPFKMIVYLFLILQLF